MKIDLFRQDTGRYPVSLDALATNGGLGPYARQQEFVDPWKHPLHYRAPRHAEHPLLFTLGADGQLGGSGQAADYRATAPN